MLVAPLLAAAAAPALDYYRPDKSLPFRKRAREKALSSAIASREVTSFRPIARLSPRPCNYGPVRSPDRPRRPSGAGYHGPVLLGPYTFPMITTAIKPIVLMPRQRYSRAKNASRIPSYPSACLAFRFRSPVFANFPLVIRLDACNWSVKLPRKKPRVFRDASGDDIFRRILLYPLIIAFFAYLVTRLVA